MGKSTFKKIGFTSSSTKKRKFDPKIKNIPDFIVSLQARQSTEFTGNPIIALFNKKRFENWMIIVSLHPLPKAIDPWCNGSTSDFGSAC